MKREGLQAQIAYFEERRDIMRYDEYRREDLVLATGVIEGACRYVVKERLDCAGMRWTLEGAERLLQLRCIELNGDWERFITWAENQTTQELVARKPVKLRHQKPKSSFKNLPKTGRIRGLRRNAPIGNPSYRRSLPTASCYGHAEQVGNLFDEWLVLLRHGVVPPLQILRERLVLRRRTLLSQRTASQCSGRCSNSFSRATAMAWLSGRVSLPRASSCRCFW